MASSTTRVVGVLGDPESPFHLIPTAVELAVGKGVAIPIAEAVTHLNAEIHVVIICAQEVLCKSDVAGSGRGVGRSTVGGGEMIEEGGDAGADCGRVEVGMDDDEGRNVYPVEAKFPGDGIAGGEAVKVVHLINGTIHKVAHVGLEYVGVISDHFGGSSGWKKVDRYSGEKMLVCCAGSRAVRARGGG